MNIKGNSKSFVGFLNTNKVLIASIAIVSMIGVSAISIDNNQSKASVLNSSSPVTIPTPTKPTTTTVSDGGVAPISITAPGRMTSCTLVSVRSDGYQVCCPTGTAYQEAKGKCYPPVVQTQTFTLNNSLADISAVKDSKLDFAWYIDNMSACVLTAQPLSGTGSAVTLATSGNDTKLAVFRSDSTFSTKMPNVSTSYTLSCTNTKLSLSLKKTIKATLLTSVVVPIITPGITIPTTATPTDPLANSSSYIFLPSTNSNISFGLDSLNDSCKSYEKITTDVSNINTLLKSHIAKAVGLYFKSSCNTKTNLNAECTSYIDTVNNLLLSYATYKVEAFKVSKDKALLCDSNNKSTGASRKDWVTADLESVVYASLRNLYANNSSFSTPDDLFSKLDSGLQSNFNLAYSNGKFVDSGSNTKNLRTLGSSYFALKTNSAISVAVTAINKAVANQVISSSMISPFYIFGLKNNTSGNNISILAFNSTQEYGQYFNQSPVKFSDLNA